MKSLNVKSDNCILTKCSFGVEVNDKDIRELIKENLPKELKDYEKYPVKLDLKLEFLGDEDLTVVTEGYKLKDEEMASEEEGEDE